MTWKSVTADNRAEPNRDRERLMRASIVFTQ
nr:MAG TPA: hypothetical protein [Caudoviricetes sp.]